LVLANLQSQKPPRAQDIGFLSFLHRAGMTDEEVKIEFRRQQEATWWQMTRVHHINLAFSPVSGGALAGGVLAIWRLITRRFGFPVEPGHWLLVTFAALMLVAALRSHLQRFMSADSPDLVATLLALCLSLFVAMFARVAIYWRLTFGLLATSCGALALAFTISNPRQEPASLFTVGLLGVLTFPFAAIICSVANWVNGEKFDIFHSFGMFVMVGMMAHFGALFAVR
jgi:hypothetical protein